MHKQKDKVAFKEVEEFMYLQTMISNQCKEEKKTEENCISI